MLANTCPAVGMKVRLTMLLENLSSEARALDMTVEGEVLRVDALGSDRGGFAVKSDETILRNSNQTIH